MSNTTRIFSFGLGSAPSRALVKGLARVTNGSYLFIPPNTHVDVAIARQLDTALEPCLVNVKVQCHFDNNELKDYRISPKTLPPIHVKQRLNVYVLMPKIIEGTLSGSIEFLTEKVCRFFLFELLVILIFIFLLEQYTRTYYIYWNSTFVITYCYTFSS